MISPNLYIHDSDRKALNALKSIPGFTQVFKAFMKVWSEKQYRIQNMSTNLRINENQLPEYYEMLPPICEKLGIKVPELYLELDGSPNAYTAGDTEPFIVITSGLLKCMPKELIPTVLAHECGHIACHHCLYTTMGQVILSEAIRYLGIPEIAVMPVQSAFAYWMRCSEYSADRAAALCTSPESIIEMCLRFSGFEKDIKGVINLDEFMNQAAEYKSMMETSGWNKTLEFLMFSQNDHPLNAVRAYECFQWAQTDKFARFMQHVNNELPDVPLIELMGEIPVPEAAAFYTNKNVNAVVEMFREYGFTRIITEAVPSKGFFTKDGNVASVIINGNNSFEMNTWFTPDSEIRIYYYGYAAVQSFTALPPDKVRIPEASWTFTGTHCKAAEEAFRNAGFTNISFLEQKKETKGIFDKDFSVCSVSINGNTIFNKNDPCDKISPVVITYNTFNQQ